MPETQVPIDPDFIQAFLERLDEAGETLREVLDDAADADSPSIRFYLEGASFIEAGYLMVEQLAGPFPSVFRALHDDHYDALFQQARRGQVGWAEALEGLPAFLRDAAMAKVHEELFQVEE